MVSRASGGPTVALAVQPFENPKRPDTSFRAFERLSQIHLNHFLVLNDQGSARQSISKKYGCDQIMCLRHLFVSLKQGTFGSPLSVRESHSFRPAWCAIYAERRNFGMTFLHKFSGQYQ
jgi:hypothetical protein